MATPFLCVFLALLLTYLMKIPVAMAMAKQPGGYDNNTPRAQQDKLTGWGMRALAAHRNSFEMFPPFAAAVIIAHITGADESYVSLLAIAFIVSRVGYFLAYIGDAGTLRSALWMAGMGAIGALFFAPVA